MGKLQKVSHQDVPLMSSFESADSIREPFVPNDFAEDGSYPMSTKGKSLKRKLSSVRRRNVESLNVFFIEGLHARGFLLLHLLRLVQFQFPFRRMSAE
nr:uncharacterized protein LOC109779219 isoform X2 [Aegilops tauschii subsp. strangulata]